MASAPSTSSSITEYNIRVPKNQKKKYQVMRYNSSLNIDFQKWSQVKIDRENNMREQKGFDDAEQPKFGAGSEFGRDAREEARRKKFGIVNRRYKSEAQPWLIKVKQAGKNYGYRGVREGGIAENASYYVFTHAPDGGIDAYPLQEWYNFQPVQRYKALSAEEAEEEFGRRNKLMNYFSVMTRKRCRGKDDDAELDDPEEAKLKKGGTKKKELKISDMDDWMDSSEEDESGSEKGDDDNDKEEAKQEKDKKKKQKEKAKNIKKKKKKRDVDDEAFEESDDGDEEGREVDYISDSSDSESDNEGKANKELKGVSEEKALRNLLSSGSSSEDEDDKKEKERESDNEDEKKEGEKEGKAAKDGEKDGKASKKKKKKKGDKKVAGKKDDAKRASSSDFSSDSDTDEELEAKRKAKKDGGKGASKEKEGAKGGKEKDGAKGAKEKDSKDTKDLKGAKETKEANEVKESTSGGSSRSGTPTREVGEGNKRKLASTPEPSLSKKMRLDNFASAPYSASPVINNEAGITEDAVRRYLMRKPMTTTELLQKFKSKKTGLSSEQLVNIMTQILKRINPVKQTIKGKMYLSIKR